MSGNHGSNLRAILSDKEEQNCGRRKSRLEYRRRHAEAFHRFRQPRKTVNLHISSKRQQCCWKLGQERLFSFDASHLFVILQRSPIKNSSRLSAPHRQKIVQRARPRGRQLTSCNDTTPFPCRSFFSCILSGRRRGADEKDRLTLFEMGLAGGWAGVANAPVRQVFERVKSVMQVDIDAALATAAALLPLHAHI